MVQKITNFFKFKEKKKEDEIISKISNECKNSEIFDLFLLNKLKNYKQTIEDPVLKIFKLKNQFVLQKINEIKKNNKTKKDIILKSFKLLEEKFQYFKEVYREFNKSEQYYFSFKGKNKSVCFLKSEKKHSLLESFAFEVFYTDVFVHAKREYFNNKYSDCIISSKRKDLLRELRLIKKLDPQWKFDDESNTIKSIQFKQLNIHWEELKKLFLSLALVAV